MSISVCLALPDKPDLQKQWDFVLSNFPPAELFVIGDSRNAPPTNVFAKNSAAYMLTADGLPRGRDLIVLAPPHGKYIAGTTPLHDFDHPDDAIYLFGPDHLFLSSDQMGQREHDAAVFIPTASTDDMYGHVAYAITVWDRGMKRG